MSATIIDRTSRCSAGATEFYVLDLDISALGAQLASSSPAFQAAVDVGGVTLSIRPPSADEPAAVVGTATSLDINFSDLMGVLRPAARDLGYGDSDIRVRVAGGVTSFEIPIEIYEPSVVKRTIAYRLDTMRPA